MEHGVRRTEVRDQTSEVRVKKPTAKREEEGAGGAGEHGAWSPELGAKRREWDRGQKSGG
jgi:hypothetical protein